jgi:hypothetical protein
MEPSMSELEKLTAEFIESLNRFAQGHGHLDLEQANPAVLAGMIF